MIIKGLTFRILSGVEPKKEALYSLKHFRTVIVPYHHYNGSMTDKILLDEAATSSLWDFYPPALSLFLCYFLSH